ncbi:MAG: DNA topoisomerase [Cyclobacteriaceae bacterium]
MKLIIAEKPLTAQPIAANRKAVNKREGYYEGNGYIVTSAYGHLVELFEPEDYDSRYKEWKLEDLPILPDFRYKIHEEKYRKSRFELIKQLLGKATEVINACDSDREGENIFWSIIKMSGYTDIAKCKRLWYSDYTDESLNTAFENLRPLAEFENSYKSAETRQKADWLYGMNLSRLLTKTAKSGNWTFGRVQTPTLMIVCDAYKRHTDFIETPYWKVRVTLEKGIRFYATNERSFLQKQQAESLYNTIHEDLICSSKEVKEKKEHAPALFSLSALQREASKLFHLKMDKTLEAAQSLYEKHKLTTYPRSDSRYLPESMKSDVLRCLERLQGFKTVPESIRQAAGLVSSNGISSTPFDDKKVGSHHAIIPTSEVPDGKELTQNEQIVYLLIVKQFVGAFMPACIKKQTRLEFKHDIDVFKAYGSEVITEGWRLLDDALQILKTGKQADPDQPNEEQRLPEVQEGEKLPVVEKIVLEKKTQKPSLLTTEALSKLMETAGKLVDDEQLAEAMKTCGIGTEATRAEIVKRLYELAYIQDKGRYIIPTQDGLELYKVLKDYKIASPELTGIFENKLHDIVSGRIRQEEFLKETVAMMIEHMELLKQTAKDLESSKNEKQDVGGVCPLCKEGQVVIGNNSYLCSKAKWSKVQDNGDTIWQNDGCHFQISKKVAGKIISPSMVRELLDNGLTKNEISGFINKAGKPFSARLKLNDHFKLEFADHADGATISCPKCKQSKVRVGEKGISCLDKACDFFIYRIIAQKKLTDAQLISLVEKKKTGIIKGLKSKAGKAFETSLVLNNEHKVEFNFAKGKGTVKRS